MFGRQAAKEPEEGSWIWLPDADRRDNRRVFFRREFVAPADADVFQLQISVTAVILPLHAALFILPAVQYHGFFQS